MSQLVSLREQLGSLRRRRRAVRLGTALVAVVVALLWTLAVIFVLDWQLSMSRAQRVVALLLGAGAIAWAYRKYAWPMLGTRETELDVALMVERQQQIDSDLVAALQFESPEAKKWGSPQLEGAVISYVAEFSRGCNLLEGFSAEQFVRRGVALIVTLLLLIGAVIWQPEYAATFFKRLAMGSDHYPTNTRIDEVRVNNTLVVGKEKTDLDGKSVVTPVRLDEVRTGYGQPVEFAVRVSGQIPSDMHRIELTSVSSGVSRPIELKVVKPAAHDIANSSKAADTADADSAVVTFRAQLPALVDSLQFQVFAGDAWTDPTNLDVIQLPEIQPKLTPTPPKYAQKSVAVSDEPAGSRQLSVIRGSRIDLEIACLNKGLKTATLTIGKKSYELKAKDDDRRHWALPPTDSPLARIDDEVKYQIQVTDDDGMQLPKPMEGTIQIKFDRPPTITASVEANVEYFRPDAGLPKINFKADDDYGLAAISATVEIQHEGSTEAQPKPQTLEVPIDAKMPLVRPKIPISGVYLLPLSKLKLVKGDQLKLTLEATSYRGDQPGKTTKSDPLVLRITDESGIMAALGEKDILAADKLNTLIERQKMDVLMQRQKQTGGLK